MVHGKMGGSFYAPKKYRVGNPPKVPKNVGFDGNCVWANWIVMDPNENPEE